MRQTTLEEVKEIAASGNYGMIPVSREILADIRTPVEVLRALQNVSTLSAGKRGGFQTVGPLYLPGL